MTRTPLLALLILAPTFGSAGTVRAASIVYQIQSYAAFQNGFTLSGSIITDGNFGTLTSNDILAWSYTISQGAAIVDQESGTNIGIVVENLTASQNQLTLTPSVGPTNELSLSMSGQAAVLWARNPNPGGDMYEGLRVPTMYWSDIAPSPGLQLPTSSPWIIAQVPEPSTLTLALLGGACLAVGHGIGRAWRGGSGPQASPTLHS